MSQELTGADLKKRIAEILKDADLETTSAKKVRMQLEEDTKSDLTSRKEEIGKLIQEVIDDMEDDEDEEEEEDEKPKNGDVRSPKKNGASKNKDSEEESEEETPTKKPARRAAAVKKSKYNEDSEDESDESEISEEEKPKKSTPNAGRGKSINLDVPSHFRKGGNIFIHGIGFYFEIK